MWVWLVEITDNLKHIEILEKRLEYYKNYQHLTKRCAYSPQSCNESSESVCVVYMGSFACVCCLYVHICIHLRVSTHLPMHVHLWKPQVGIGYLYY